MTTVRPGVMPLALSSAVSFATSARTAFATATPSMTVAVFASASKVHRPRLSDDNNLALTRVLQLGFNATRDFVVERCHSHVVDIFRRDEYAHFASSLDRVNLVHAAIARRDLLDSLESLDVGLERFA